MWAHDKVGRLKFRSVLLCPESTKTSSSNDSSAQWMYPEDTLSYCDAWWTTWTDTEDCVLYPRAHDYHKPRRNLSFAFLALMSLSDKIDNKEQLAETSSRISHFFVSWQSPPRSVRRSIASPASCTFPIHGRIKGFIIIGWVKKMGTCLLSAIRRTTDLCLASR